MAEENKIPEQKKTEESQPGAPKGAKAGAQPEEGKAKKSFSFLGAALFGAMVMNAILLGLVTVKPRRIVEKMKTAIPTAEELVPLLPVDLPDPERHIDILMGMADAERRLGNLNKSMEYYAAANRSFETSAHAESIRRGPLQAAEALFAEKKYREARARYYSFLCSADELPASDHVAIEQAHFRIAECYLQEALSAGGKRQ